MTIAGLTISGADAGNYTLVQPTTTAKIGLGLTVTGITASDKVYDGTTTATLDTSGITLVGVVAGETFRSTTVPSRATLTPKMSAPTRP